MAKKKAAKKSTKKSAKTVAKKATGKKKKAAPVKKTARKVAKKVARAKKSAPGKTRPKPPTKKNAKRSKPVPKKRKRSSPATALAPNERLEKMTVGIQAQESGDLIVTESAGGAIRVHHTVHPDAAATPIPGKSFDDLEKLGEGSHEIEVKRTL